MKPFWIRAAEFCGITPSQRQIRLMERFEQWLDSEAIPAGGLGPGERDRLDRRHLADSVLFASQMGDRAGTVWDLGSGVGLPGIPLAICLPDTEFVLIDRSGRRIDLLRRAIRVLGVDNCRVEHSEIEQLTGVIPTIVTRATFPPPTLTGVVSSLLAPDGVAVAAGSWRETPVYPEWNTIEIPRHVLDHTVWLLIMRRQ